MPTPVKAREREQELLWMFNRAAEDVTNEDVEERESLLGGFVGSRAPELRMPRRGRAG